LIQINNTLKRLPQTIRRNQLKLLLALADSTTDEMEQRGEPVPRPKRMRSATAVKTSIVINHL
jgi:hypothetical protein